MTAYYNENDPKAAAWLRELIAAGHIAPGHVDERSITEVRSDELEPFAQCHFFAGIGGWSLALRLAGWPDDRRVWTGSAPCQPFSGAGKQQGEADPRHLWPDFRRLIAERHPAIVFGEQVASALGRGWLAGVRADLEAVGYAVGAADLCAASAGAPHIRQRLWWVADASGVRRGARRGERRDEGGAGSGRDQSVSGGEPCGLEHSAGDGRLERRAAPVGRSAAGGCGAGGLGDAIVARPQGHAGNGDDRGESGRLDAHAAGPVATAGGAGGLADAECDGVWGEEHGPLGGEKAKVSGEVRQQRIRLDAGADGGAGGRSPWSNSVLIPCGDGKSRRIEPGIAALAHGIPGRVGLLRGYGNAIVPQVAAEFIRAYVEASGELMASNQESQTTHLHGAEADALAGEIGWLAVRLIDGGAAQVIKRGSEAEVKAAAKRDLLVHRIKVGIYRPHAVMEAR